MDCCGYGHFVAPKPWVWSTPLVSVGAMLAGAAGPRGSTAAAQTAETTAAALAVLRNSISVDVHSHGGSTGITSKAPPSGDLANAMSAGSLAVACLADVPDWPVLGRNAEGALAMVRTPAPDELYRYHLDRLAWMDELVVDHGVRRVLNAADLEAAHKAGEPAVIADVEGLDFVDGKLERLEEAHERGIRHVQLVHYTLNDIGDFQTGAITHQGLTEFGAEVIRACDRLGFVCDVAHATEDMAKQAVKVATKPLLLSHTAVLGSRAMGPTPLGGRQVSSSYARAIAETGGSVGIWHFFPSIDRYVDGLKEMAEIVGVDHVSIGTDQFDARGCVEDYTRWVHLVAAMLRGGFTPEEAGKIAGGKNAPTGVALPRAEIARLLEDHPDMPVVIDEAYVDFGGESAVPLIADHPNLLVVQTMSKSRALAGLRVGYALGSVGLIEALHRVKNSFNSYPLGRLAQAARRLRFTTTPTSARAARGSSQDVKR